MTSLNYKDIYNLRLFTIFAVLAEMVHVYINDAPPIYLRLAYIGIYLAFCFYNIKLIPFFTTINLILERFSISFGEFLPNTLWWHVIILFIGFSIWFKDHKPIYYCCGTYEYLSLIFFLFVVVSNYVINISIVNDLGFVTNVLFSILFLQCIFAYSTAEIKLLVQFIILSTFIMVILSLTHYNDLTINFHTTSGYVERLQWKDSNYISFFIGIISLITLFFPRKDIGNKQLFYIVSILLFIIAISLLLSRGTILFFTISLIYYYRKDIFKVTSIKYSILIGVILAVSYQIGFLDNIIERFLSEDFETGSGRINIWRQGLNTFFSKDIFTIIFGAGVNQAIYMASMNDINWSTHNNYLEILFNYGLVGLIVFLFFLLSLFFSCNSNEKRTIVLYIILSCMTIVPFTYVTPIWIIIPIVMIFDNKVLQYE